MKILLLVSLFLLHEIPGELDCSNDDFLCSGTGNKNYVLNFIELEP